MSVEIATHWILLEGFKVRSTSVDKAGLVSVKKPSVKKWECCKSFSLVDGQAVSFVL